MKHYKLPVSVMCAHFLQVETALPVYPLFLIVTHFIF